MPKGHSSPGGSHYISFENRSLGMFHQFNSAEIPDGNGVNEWIRLDQAMPNRLDNNQEGGWVFRHLVNNSSPKTELVPPLQGYEEAHRGDTINKLSIFMREKLADMTKATPQMRERYDIELKNFDDILARINSHLSAINDRTVEYTRATIRGRNSCVNPCFINHIKRSFYKEDESGSYISIVPPNNQTVFARRAP